jgi:cardiolipin synthase (CMP-forming)
MTDAMRHPPRGEPGASRQAEQVSEKRIVTLPNALSFVRILMIPVYVMLLSRDDRGSEAAGLLILGAVVSTDWVDGWIARRTGQVSDLGKVLDPVADRLALAAALITLVVRRAFPLWAALLVLVRDALLLLVGAVLLVSRRVRIDVRWVGKVATLALMFAIPSIAWGNFGLFLHTVAKVAGWMLFAVGITAYYVATVMYAGDIRRAIHPRGPGRVSP